MNTKQRLYLGIFALMLLCILLPAQAREVEFSARLSTPSLLAGEQQTAYLRIALRGFEMSSEKRAPLNVAVVLDKSGSMGGQKIEKAKAAAMQVLDRLNDQDIFSLVVYDSTVQVLIPATKVSDRHMLKNRIRGIQSNGGTALFAGVSKGAAEVRKFKELERVNRIILLSDGKANEGPSSPDELGQLGASLVKSGITVSTIGLGLDYNEDLMAKLAERGNGSFIFAEEAQDLITAFDIEFGEALTTVTQNTFVHFSCGEGVRPVRVIGREAIIDGQNITVDLGQLYSKQLKYLVLEVEVPAGENGELFDLGKASMECFNLSTKTKERQERIVQARFVAKAEEVETQRDREVSVSVVKQLGVETNTEAMKLRDEGKVQEAQDALLSNGLFLNTWGEKLESKELKDDAYWNDQDSQNLGDRVWSSSRKAMKEKQLSDTKQSQRMGRSSGTRGR